MAAGVPVVQPAHGAFTEMVLRTGGGVLVAPDDPDALAEGNLAAVAGSAAPRALGHRGAGGVRQHYSVQALGRAARSRAARGDERGSAADAGRVDGGTRSREATGAWPRAAR